jgi:hypothetical protein
MESTKFEIALELCADEMCQSEMLDNWEDNEIDETTPDYESDTEIDESSRRVVVSKPSYISARIIPTQLDRNTLKPKPLQLDPTIEVPKFKKWIIEKANNKSILDIQKEQEQEVKMTNVAVVEEFLQDKQNVRSIVCKFGKRCQKLDSCSYAHCIEEFTPSHCKHAASCHKNTCQYLHPNETVNELVQRCRLNIQSKNLPVQRMDNSFSQICKNITSTGVNNCKYGQKCKYAHTAEQYNPLQCKYGAKCVNNTCGYKHPNESIHQYMNRKQILLG